MSTLNDFMIICALAAQHHIVVLCGNRATVSALAAGGSQAAPPGPSSFCDEVDFTVGEEDETHDICAAAQAASRKTAKINRCITSDALKPH
jgi:hypothetical protein